MKPRLLLKRRWKKTCKITRFVIICNYENKIIDAIRSRCAGFRFNPISDDKMIEKLKEISESEGMDIEDDKVYTSITKICEGDARRSINTLQNLKYIPKLDHTIEMTDHLRGLSDKLRADLLKECQESNLQKTNHNDKDDRGLITVEHVNLITSSINYDYFDRYWKMIKKCPDADELNNVAHAIVIEGYPMDYVLKFFKDKIIECDLNDIDKAEVLLFIGNVERMLINGSGNHIQTLAILTIIVSKYKGMSIRIPNIY